MISIDKDKNKTAQTQKGLLLSGVIILTVASILGKIFGFIYKVPLNAILGDEMANVNSAYAIYTTLYMISTAGIPVAISVLISESRAQGRAKQTVAIYRVALLALAIVGFVSTIIMIFVSGPISIRNSGGDTFLCMLAISPALFFVAISSAYRGYFQGHGLMKPTAISQLIESFGKMVVGLLLAYLCVGRLGLEKSVAAALSIFGVTVGIGAGAIYLMITKRRYANKGMLSLDESALQDSSCDGSKKILKSLVAIAFPIAVSSAVMSLSSLVDSQMMRPLLEGYYSSPEIAKAIYSDYSTGALTMFNMPLVLITPIACAIVPFITSAIASDRMNDASRIMDSSLRMTAIVAFPCALGMSALASPILSLVFRGDADMAENAGRLLSVLALSIILVGMLSVTNAVLQSHHLQSLPIFSMAAGLLVKTICSYYLIGRYGEIGAPVSTLLFYFTVVIFNFVFLIKYVKLKPNLVKIFVRPLFCSAICALSAYLIYYFTVGASGLTVSVLLSISVAALVYFVFTFALKCITKEDIELVPKAEKILPIIEKLHLI